MAPLPMSAAVASASERDRSLTATRAPSSASRSAIARPMPLAAPVTSAHRPSRPLMEAHRRLNPWTGTTPSSSVAGTTGWHVRRTSPRRDGQWSSSNATRWSAGLRGRRACSPPTMPCCRSTRTSSACCRRRSSTSSASTSSCAAGTSRPPRCSVALGTAMATMAERVFPTLTEPLRSAGDFRRLIGDEAWQMFVERPIGEAIEAHIADDTLRGIVLTDALIGTFTHAHDLLANRCFLYHVVGRGTGHWDIPVGGMGTVSAQLAAAAEKRGAELGTGVEVVGLSTDGERAEVRTADGRTIAARQVFANVAPAVLRRLLGQAPSGPAAGGRPGQGQHAPRPPAPTARSGRQARAGVRRHVPRQRGLRPVGDGLSPGSVGSDPGGRPVRGLLPLAGRSVDPLGRAAGGRRAHAHAVRAAHAGAAVPRRPARRAGRGQGARCWRRSTACSPSRSRSASSTPTASR